MCQLLQGKFAHTDRVREIVDFKGQVCPSAFPVGSQANMTTVKSKFPDVSIPTDKSWPEYVYQHFDTYGERTAIVDGSSGHSYSFAQLKDLTKNFSSALTERGFQQRDVFAIFLPNVPEYAIVFYGVAFIGGTVTTVNPLYTIEELEKQLCDTSASYIVTIPSLLDKVKTAGQTQGKLKRIFVVGTQDASDGCEPFSALLNNDGSSFPVDCSIGKDDVVTLPYSSGTTGLPKGVMLTHYNLVANACMFESAEVLKMKGAVVMAVLPFYHIYGQLIIMGIGLFEGATLVVQQRFEPDKFLQAMQDYKVTFAPIVPPIVLFLAKHPMVDNYDLSNLTEITSGAAPMGKGLEEAFIQRLPQVKHIRQGFGMTEVLITHVQLSGQRKAGSVGILLPNLECKVVDVVTGKTLGLHEDGEIYIRGPVVMKGYLNNPEATARTIDSDGWARTGDIGHYDEDGHFYIVDRLKELIKYNAYQVAPAELEALLITHPKIDDAAVIGVPDEKAGELPKAFIVPKGDIMPEQVADFLAAKVAPQKKLRGGVEFIDKIPKSASGKILRRQLKQLEIDRLSKV